MLEFRTLFVAVPDEAETVRERVAAALKDATGWRVISVIFRPVAEAERGLAERLLSGPQLAG